MNFIENLWELMKPSGPSRPQVWHLWFEPKWWDWCALFEEAILEHKWIRTKLFATITVVYIENCCPRTDLSVMLWYSELLWVWSMYKAVNNGCQTVTVTTPVRSDCCCCTWPLSFHGEGAGEKEQQQLGIRFQLPKLRRTEPSLGGEDAFCVSHHIFLT